MKQIAQWLITCAVIVSIAVPKLAYACSPDPAYWEVEIISISPNDSLLPADLAFESHESTIILRNDSALEATLLSQDIPLIIAAPGRHVLLLPIKRYLLIPDAPPHLTFYEEEPALPDEVVLTVQHGNSHYSAPTKLGYNIEFVPADPKDCIEARRSELIRTIIPLLMLGSIVVATGAVLTVIGIAYLKDRQAKP